MRGQRGFTLPGVLAMLVIALTLALAAFAAAQGGMKASGASRDDKQAYAAAEAGLNWYLSRLIYDNAFWTKCTTVAGPSAPVNDPWNGSGADPRRWRAVPDSTADYTIELVPANGAQRCDVANPNGTMIDGGTGTFKIRATGRFAGSKHTLVATFRRSRFLDFLYLTEYETTDPLNYPASQSSTAAACAEKLRPDRSGCSEIQFGAYDEIEGPLHSNDSLYICGAAKFGRTRADAIETSAGTPGWSRPNGCSGTPNFVGTFRTNQGTVQMPTTDEELVANVGADYRFAGSTTINLRGDIDKVVVTRQNGTQVTRNWPTNGLLYVEGGTGGCTGLAPARIPAYTGSNAESPGCANATVRGTYRKDITVYSTKDVVVDDDITMVSGSNAVAGLMAGRFVRVKHPVVQAAQDNGSCNTTSDNNASGSVTNLRIEAAILAVNNSFTVDNYRCGSSLGTLTVRGGIAQSYRGAVATGAAGAANVTSGYRKDYGYDDRFVYRNPPFFLEPSSATWRIVRSAEQAPAR